MLDSDVNFVGNIDLRGTDLTHLANGGKTIIKKDETEDNQDKNTMKNPELLLSEAGGLLIIVVIHLIGQLN